MNGPNEIPIGEMIQEPGLMARGKAYTVGEPVQYDSIYGYNKLRFPVYLVDTTNGHRGSCVGWIKQEPMPDENGKLVGFTYYTKEGWRKEGQLRFYPSPEALLSACQMPVFPGTVIVPGEAADQAEDTVADAVQPGEVADADG